MAAYDDDFRLNRPDPDEDPIRYYVEHSPAPNDARRMGLDKNTEEGALVAMAAGLKPARLSHKIIAWVLLLFFAGPAILAVVRTIF